MDVRVRVWSVCGNWEYDFLPNFPVRRRAGNKHVDRRSAGKLAVCLIGRKKNCTRADLTDGHGGEGSQGSFEEYMESSADILNPIYSTEEQCIFIPWKL